MKQRFFIVWLLCSIVGWLSSAPAAVAMFMIGSLEESLFAFALGVSLYLYPLCAFVAYSIAKRKNQQKLAYMLASSPALLSLSSLFFPFYKKFLHGF